MKEATGELNMTLVTILAVAAILAFVTFFVPNILDSISNNWSDDTVLCDGYNAQGKCIKPTGGDAGGE